MKNLFLLTAFIIILTGDAFMQQFISKQNVDKVISQLVKKFGDEHKARITKGVTQVAALWQKVDGNEKDFEKFCCDYFIADQKQLQTFFNRVSDNFESIYGNLNKISLDLKRQTQLDLGEIFFYDEIFAAYDPFAHLQDDFFTNKLAFMIILNFPNYTLQEKNTLGNNWTRLQWAYARLGDMFISRVPANINMKISQALSDADNYISNYNIYIKNLVDDKGNQIFTKDVKLISHWGLRDEIKALYAEQNSLQKQLAIYNVMKHIIYQEIPQDVINQNKYKWDPFTNKLYYNGKEIKFKPEPNTRYKTLLRNYQTFKLADPYYPNYPTYIDRRFNLELEMSINEVKALFDELCSSDVLVNVGKYIEKKLGRKLQPFDIWYDGFKNRSSISQDELDKIVRSKFKDIKSLEKSFPDLLVKLGYDKDKANYIASKIVVDPARGAGHASGAMMRGDVAHLRTRVDSGGMDYKGFNIAAHEFGHNVEQTISLYDVDYYMLQGVPNTAFTEALAFTFQKRDLFFLDINDNNSSEKEYLQTLDILWGSFEIMGVSLVDIEVWEWMYKNPNATDEELKNQTIQIAKNVWNKYFARIFGIKDEPILAIYSHMIDYPLYLPAYPLGHLIEFCIEDKIQNKNIANEIQSMFQLGRLTPYHWMMQSFNYPLSSKPLIDKSKEAIKYFND